MTRATLDNFDSGDIAVLSSRVNCSGRSRTFLRTMPSGARGPSTARAKTNTVSSGATREPRVGSSVTVPLTTPATATAADAGAALAATGGRPASCRASAMLPRICCAKAGSAPSTWTSVSHRSIAAL